MTPSLPLDQSSTRSAWISPTPGRETLRGERECTVAIIGGGMSGISAADRLIELGEHPILIEAGILAGRGTGTNTAIVSAACASEKNATRMLQSYGRERTQEIFGWVHSGIARMHRFIDGENERFDVRSDGYLSLYTDPREAQDEIAALASLGISGRLIEGREVQDFADTSFYPSAIHLSDSNAHYVFNPYTLVHAVASRLERAGLTIFENTAARRIQRTERGLVIETAHGSIRAKKIILAVNPFLLNMSYLPRHIRRAVVPVFQHVSLVEFSAAAPIRRCSAFADSASLDYAFGNISGNKLMISAGNFEFVLTGEAKKLADAERANTALIRSRFPGYEFKVLSTWGGRIGGSLAKGFLPQTGFIDQRRDIYVASVGDGLAWASHLGAVAADCVMERASPPPSLALGKNYTLANRTATMIPLSVLELLAPLVYRLR